MKFYKFANERSKGWDFEGFGLYGYLVFNPAYSRFKARKTGRGFFVLQGFGMSFLIAADPEVPTHTNTLGA